MTDEQIATEYVKLLKEHVRLLKREIKSLKHENYCRLVENVNLNNRVGQMLKRTSELETSCSEQIQSLAELKARLSDPDLEYRQLLTELQNAYPELVKLQNNEGYIYGIEIAPHT